MGDRGDPFFSPADAIVFGLENAGDIDGNGVNDLVYSGSRYSIPLGKSIGVINAMLLNEDGTFKGNTDVISLGGYVSDSSLTYSSITLLGSTADGDRKFAVTSPFFATSSAAQANLTVLTFKNPPAVIPDATTVVLDSSSTDNPRYTVKWNSSANATSYLVWVRNLSTGKIVVNSLEVIGTEYTPVTDWGIGKYSVYVRAKSEAGVSAWSPGRDFTINTPVEAIPVADGMNPRPTFSWNPLAGAVKYDVRVATVEQFQLAILRAKVDASATSFVPTKDLASGTYRLMVLGIAADGSVGSWSQPMDFTIVTSTAITSVSGQPTSRPDFTFTALEGAVKYETWISNLTTPSQQPIQITTTDASTTFRPNINLAAGRYRIWIRGVAADGSFGAWSSPVDFSANQIPHLRSTTPYYAPGDRVNLRWDGIEGSARYELWYQDPGAGPGNHRLIDFGRSVGNNLLTLGGIGRHQFWVRAVSADGRTGRWSSMLEVTVDTAVESVRVSSNAGAFDRPKFTWHLLPGAESYEIRINDLVNYVTAAITAKNLVTPTYSSGVSLPLGTYSFQVRGIARDGTVGNWSVLLLPQTFQVPQLQPTNGRTFLPQLQWTPVFGAESYTFVVWNTDTGKPLGPSYDTGNTSANVPIESEGRYSWSVRANGPGLPALMSEPQTFVVTTRPVLTVPATFESNLETKSISWSAIQDGLRYDIWISTDQYIKVKQDQVSLRTTFNLPTDTLKGIYRVWVRAVSSHNALSAWSLPAVFEII